MAAIITRAAPRHSAAARATPGLVRAVRGGTRDPFGGNSLNAPGGLQEKAGNEQGRGGMWQEGAGQELSPEEKRLWEDLTAPPST